LSSWAEFAAVAPRPSVLYLAIGYVSRPLLKLLFRPRTTGLDHVPREGGFVLAANHLSNLDPWAIGLPLFPWRFLRFMGKSELFRWPLGPILEAGGAFKVRRGQADVEAIETAVQLAREGHVVVMFPEGTRRKKGIVKKWQPRAHTGATRIALAAGVPLIPAAVKGTDTLRRLGPLRVAYGPPLALEDLRDDDPRDAAEEATDRLMAEIARLEGTL
jgi:1-acyl-sn-glycerol-3-phosphate acyltransferase